MTASKTESELKFEIGADEAARLAAHPALDLLAAGAARTRTLRSIYYDNGDDALFQKNISLRVRRADGEWIQTVKRGARMRGGLATPLESEIKVSGPEPELDSIEDASLAADLRGVLGDSSPAARFETRIERETHVLRVPEGTVELALDTGEVQAGQRQAPLVEAELELLDGDVSALYTVARMLMDGAPLAFSPESKSARGFRLVRGEAPVDPGPRKGLDLAITEAMTAEDAFAAILRACLERIAHNRLASIASDAPEGPHQLRVALRRLRTAFKIFRPLAKCDTAQRLDAEARALAKAAGELRDCDVLLADILAPAAEAGGDVKALSAWLEARRLQVRAQVRTALSDASVNAFLLDLGGWVETTGWRAKASEKRMKTRALPVREFAVRALAKRWKACARQAEDLDALSIEERHALRRKLKKLRYALEFFAELFDKDEVKAFRKQLKRLQDVFGYLNDVAMAERLMELEPGKRGDRDEALRAAGFALGWHQARADHAWLEARDRWTALAETRRFWE